MTLAIVILNWNGKKLLEQFLPSVVRYSPEAQLYIVDNASTDDSLDFVRTHFPEIHIVENPTNSGYAGGYNRALQHIKADVYCLLNSDVEVTPHWLEAPIHIFIVGRFHTEQIQYFLYLRNNALSIFLCSM